MDHSRSPPSPTWLPSARPQGIPKFPTSFRPFSPSQTTSSSTRSPRASRPMSSSTHLLQDLEPRTYDSPSDVESVPSEYKDSPPTPTGTVTGRKGKGLSQLTPQGGMSTPTRNITPRSKPRWQRMQQMQAYTDHNSEDEQHGLDPTPQPISRRRSKAEEELPRWARSTATGRIGREEEDGVPESMQPEWMRSSTFPRPSQDKNKVQFSIPPPITASLMLPTTPEGGRPNGQQGILSSILGAFPGGGRSEGRGEGSIGRNKISRLGEEWGNIVRQERVLQSRIQELLDLQASGLQQTGTTSGGAGSHPSDDRASRSSVRSRSNPSESSMHSVSLRSSATLNGRTGLGGKRGLHLARMELLKAMYTLSDLALAKEAVLAETSQSLQSAHKQLLAWQRKLSVADRYLLELKTDYDAENHEMGIDRQIKDIDIDIEDLEIRLKAAKETRKRLLRKKVEGKSVKEAEAAKWVEVKREVDRDVRRWLRDPNVPSDMLDDKESYRNEHWGEFMKVNPRRRNLDIAFEGLAGAISGMEERTVAAQAEIEECERCVKIWSECLELIMKSEKALKEFLQRSVSGKENLRKEMVELMNETERQLADKLHICSHEGWNLLVACLGAELEAWREGVEIMEKMIGRGDKESQDARKKHLELGSLTTENSDEEDRMQSRHSGNTNSTEDPMWGSGLDNDARILEDPSSALPSSSQGSKLLRKETTSILTPTNESRLSQLTGGMEDEVDDHVIHTEGLKISPAHSPWLNSSPKRGSSSPDREVSFRTAMEHSVQVDETNEDGEQDVENETEGQKRERRVREEKDGGDVEDEVLTPRERRVPPHLRKGPNVHNGKEAESDGEVPADLLS